MNLTTRFLLLGVKLVAFFYTGILIMLSEALDSLVDIIVTGSLLFARRASVQAGDSEHPFGHLRMRNIISLIVATSFITITSLQILREAVGRLISPVRLEHPEIALYVLGFSFIVNLVPIGLLLTGVGRREITLKTTLYDNLKDELGLLAAIGGVLAIRYGFYLADPIVSIFVALIIGVGAFTLIHENTRMLLGLSPEAWFYQRVKELAGGVAGVRGVHDMIAEYIGPEEVHLDLDLELAPETTIGEAERIVAQVAKRLRGLGVTHCKIHPVAHTGEERQIRS